MHVVSAGVHGGDGVAGGVLSLGLAGVVDAGFFLDRQGVHVGSHEECFSLAIFHHADDAELADFLGDFEARGAEFRGDALGGLLFLEAQFRRRVRRLVKLLERGIFLVDDRLDSRRRTAFFGPRGQDRHRGGQSCILC